MKKFALLAGGLLALGLGVFCACGDDGETGNPNNPPDGGDPSTPVQIGALDDTLWVDAGGTLDLANSTLDGVSSFSITGVTGTNADQVISCTADDVSYTLSLNDDGALEMRAEDNSLYRIFLADASAFAGAWYNTDDASTYYVISSTVDDEGYFSWKNYSVSSINTADPYEAVTIFEIYESGSAGLTFYIPEYEISYYYYGSGSSSVVYMNDGSALGSNQVVPYTGVFADTYMNNDGEQIAIDFNANTMTFNGNAVNDMQTGITIYGAGISFSYDQVAYALVYMNDSVYLASVNGLVSYAPYDADWLTGGGNDGGWTHGSTVASASFANDENITFDGVQCAMTKAVENGNLVYSFTAGSTSYAITPVYGSDDVFWLETDDPVQYGYWFRNSAMESFVQTYTSNSEDLVVHDDYTIDLTINTVGNDNNLIQTPYHPSATFSYIAENGAIALTFSHPVVGLDLNLILANTNGIYWAIAGVSGSYGYYSAYLTANYEATAIEQVTQSFDAEENDYFTTGGTNPDTIAFDFDTGLATMVMDSTQRQYYFSWGYYFIGDNTTEPQLYLEVNTTPENIDATHVSYTRYLLVPSAEGLTLTPSTYTIDNTAGTVETEEGADVFYLAESTFNALCDTRFVYVGQYVTSHFSINTDGSLSVETYNLSDGSTTLFTASPYDYTLGMSYVGGREVITLVAENSAGESLTIVITDRLYATINDSLVYCIEDLAEVAGTYVDGDGNSVLSISTSGVISVADGSTVTVTSIETTEGAFIVNYTNHALQYTAVFNGSTVTVTGSGSSNTYNKVSYNPERFVGTYSVSGVEISVSAYVAGINENISLVTRINGILCSSSQTYTEGNQVLTFRATDPQTLRLIICTMTLSESGLSIQLNTATDPMTAAASSWSYADFAFDDEKDLGETGTLTCVEKENAPLFILNGALCDSYTVSVSAEGVKTLDLAFGTTTVRITVGSDGIPVASVVA